jgi:hypothetical protein
MRDTAACATSLMCAWTFTVIAKHRHSHISDVSYVKTLSKNITAYCYLPI